MKKEIVQDTDDWLLWRHVGLGASEANIILGVSRFKTPKELWEEKIKPKPPKNESNFITDKGHMLEEVARKHYEFTTFMDWSPKLVTHSQQDRFRASLDGWNEELQAIWECKYMGKDKYETLKDENLNYKERIPSEYWPQLMHQVMVTDAKEVHFTGIVKVHDQFNMSFKVDDDCRLYIKETLVPKLLEFIDCIDNKTPPILSSKDTVIIKDMSLKKIITKYKSVKKKLEKLQEEETQLRDQIFKESIKTHSRVDCNGVTITQSQSEDKTVPDYKAYCESKISDNEIIVNGFSKLSKGRKIKRILIK